MNEMKNVYDFKIFFSLYLSYYFYPVFADIKELFALEN